MTKVDLFVALAPVVYMANVGLPLRLGVKTLPQVMATAEAAKLYSLFNDSEINIDFTGPAQLIVNSFVKLFTVILGPNLDFKESSTKMLWHYG